MSTSLKLLAGDKHGVLLPYLLLALTFVTGLVDAVSVLKLGRVFVANMTGNVVSVGFAIAGAPGFSLWGSALALAGFVLGASIGGVVVGRIAAGVAAGGSAGGKAQTGAASDGAASERTGAARSGGGTSAGAMSGRTRMLRNVLVVVVLLFIASVIVAWSTEDAAGPLAQNAIVVLTSFALGLQNAAVRHLAVPDLTTTVLTMTITGIAADIRSRDRIAVTRRSFAILSMLLGATAGGFIVLNVGVAPALATIVVFQLAVTLSLTVPAAEGSQTAG